MLYYYPIVEVGVAYAEVLSYKDLTFYYEKGLGGLMPYPPPPDLPLGPIFRAVSAPGLGELYMDIVSSPHDY